MEATELKERVEQIKKLFDELHHQSKALKAAADNIPLDNQLLAGYYEFLPKIIHQHQAIVKNVQAAEKQLKTVLDKLPEAWKEAKENYEQINGAIQETEFAQFLTDRMKTIILELNPNDAESN